jgi:general stress protein 26
MSQIELSYDELKQQIVNELKKHQLGVLATSEADYVRAGMMRLVSKGLTLYCLGDQNARKFKQIKANPNVAIVANNSQIEGIALVRGQPMDEPSYINAYIETQLENYESSKEKGHFHRPDFRVIEIIPKRIALYKGINIKTGSLSHIDILNIEQSKAYRISWLKEDMTSLNLKDAPAYWTTHKKP